MSVRSEGRGFRATLVVWLTTACLVAAWLAATAQSASAYVPCPDYEIEAGEISYWSQLWPPRGADAKGVTLCHGTGLFYSKGYLQIADLNDGAKLRLVSEIDLDSPPPGKLEPYTRYYKRTADDWYSYIRGGGSSTPDPSRLFSTTNASFFSDTDGPSTNLPFPHRFNHVHETWGKTMYEEAWVKPAPVCPDPEAFDYCASKTLLRIGTTAETPQRVGVGRMLNFFDAGQAEVMLRDGHSNYGPAWPGAADATLGFNPFTQVGDSEARRNYIGTYGNRVYIFTSDTKYTNQQMYDIMQAIQPGMVTMQLDGGGSAQFHSAYGWMDSNIPIADRKVPDVLAIYRAP